MQIQEIFPGGIQGVILFAGGSPRPFSGQFDGSEISRGGPEPPLPDLFTYYLCYCQILDFKMLKAFRAASVIFVLFIICISGPVMGENDSDLRQPQISHNAIDFTQISLKNSLEPMRAVASLVLCFVNRKHSQYLRDWIEINKAIDIWIDG